MLNLTSAAEALGLGTRYVARLIPARELFSWSVRAVTVPAGWLALALRTDEDPVSFRAGDRCERAGVEEVLFIRQTPVACAIEATDLRSADGFEFAGELNFSLNVLAEMAEVSAFQRTVLGAGRVLLNEDLQRYVQWQARKTMSELAAAHAAAALTRGLDPAAVESALREKLGAACLAGGLALQGPVTAEFSSHPYIEYCRRETRREHEWKDAEARTRVQEALAAAQSRRLEHLVDMLKQMRAASREHGERSMTDLIREFSPVERSEMYSALWELLPSSRRTRWVVVVSGNELLFFEPGDLGQPMQRQRLPDSLGPLRSVSADEASLADGALLVGAATGVHVVDLETGMSRRELPALLVDTRGPRGGVNAAAMGEDGIYASHSELGLLAWPRDASEPVAKNLLKELTSAARTVRGVQVVDGRIWVAIDEKVWSLSPECGVEVTYRGARCGVAAITVSGNHVYAGTMDGEVLQWKLDEPDEPCVVRRANGHAIESVDVADAGGVAWLILADQQDALTTMVLGDSHTCRYESGRHRVRRAVVASDLFAAISENRDRLFVWRPDDSSQPAGSVVVPYLTGGSIQDLCLVPA